MDNETTQRLINALVGKPCTAVEYHGGSQPALTFTPFLLYIGSPWRVSQEDCLIEDCLIIGTDPGEEDKENLRRLLTNRIVRKVSLDKKFNDLQIEFEAGILLETFGDSGIYEHWNLVAAADNMIIAGPGSLWSTF